MTEAKMGDTSSGADLETVTAFREQAALSGADSRKIIKNQNSTEKYASN